MTASVEIPSGMEYSTADEIAECLSFPDPDGRLYRKLWSFLSDSANPTPLGGDGTDGTVETPDGRTDLANDDKTRHWWHRLDAIDQQTLATAYENEYK